MFIVYVRINLKIKYFAFHLPISNKKKSDIKDRERKRKIYLRKIERHFRKIERNLR